MILSGGYVHFLLSAVKYYFSFKFSSMGCIPIKLQHFLIPVRKWLLEVALGTLSTGRTNPRIHAEQGVSNFKLFASHTGQNASDLDIHPRGLISSEKHAEKCLYRFLLKSGYATLDLE